LVAGVLGETTQSSQDVFQVRKDSSGPHWIISWNSHSVNQQQHPPAINSNAPMYADTSSVSLVLRILRISTSSELLDANAMIREVESNDTDGRCVCKLIMTE
jgi:hypothetical protein